MTTPALISPGAWWCAQFPTSVRLEDLAPPFRGKAAAFLDAVEAGVGHPCYTISATYRPPERAYLMHWSCMLANSGQDPAHIPAMDGVAIDWTAGGDRAAARAGAAAMVKAYNIAFPAALVSRHTQRRALDVTFTIPSRPKAPYRFTDGAGQTWSFGPNDLNLLYRFGATFGVIKLESDPPHWSDDGH